MNTQSKQKTLPFNFESVFTIIYKNIDFQIIQKELSDISILQNSKVTQTSIFVLLFFSYFEKLEKNIEPGNINKQIHGLRSLSPLKNFYQLQENLELLIFDFSDYFFDAMKYNVYSAMNQILQLCINDKPIYEINDNPICIKSENINLDKSDAFRATREEQQNIAVFYSFLFPIISSSETHSLDVFPSPCKPFLGRQEELQKLSEIFKSNSSVKCFLSGYSGLGKSELAKKFAHKYQSQYKKSTILYIPYEGTLKNSISNLLLSNDPSHASEDERFKIHDKYLRSLTSKDLIVIDNFNVAPTDDSYFDTIMNFRCKILFTSTYTYDEECTIKLEEIKEKEILFKLVETHYKGSSRFKDAVLKIIDKLNNHTFSIVLAAKLMKVKHIEPPKLLDLLTKKTQLFDTSEELNIKKDGKNTKSTYEQHILQLFSLFHLKNEEIKIMKNMCMIPLSGIDCSLFAEWCGYSKNMTAINNLITMGLINESIDGIISLHPLTKAAFSHKTTPKLADCSELLWSIYKICCERYDMTLNYRLIFSITDSILSDTEKPDASDEKFYRSFLIDSYNTKDFYIHFLMDVYRNMDVYRHHSGQILIINEISRLIKGIYQNNLHYKTIYFLYVADFEPDLHKRIHLYEYALDCCVLLPSSVENKLLESNIYASCASALLMQDDLESARGYLSRALEIRAQTEYLLNPDGLKQLQHYYFISALLGEENQSLDELKKYEKAMKESNPSGYASLHETIGLIYICKRKEELGEKYLSEAFKVYRQIYENNHLFLSEKRKEIEAIYHKFRDYVPKRKTNAYNLDTIEPIDK